jgi:hypothetical protein
MGDALTELQAGLAANSTGSFVKGLPHAGFCRRSLSLSKVDRCPLRVKRRSQPGAVACPFCRQKRKSLTGRFCARSGRSIPDRTKQRLGEEDLREAGVGGPPRTRRQVEMRQACLPVGQVAPVAPATYQGFVKR